ncbi:FAD-dependent oxidoreductase [Luteibacter rhizovicinus DSM 16549]|uniref:FAD-dependent oxidoreductase n=1 Tax=Luteibacter rhizovicinus DSM 16549 TaxID=1440763 RepID=A0A0G9H429_9GAMM|nr:FAD-binding oxidoreductase [Luteibacter rhizovicinus]APG05748.1 FAD-dependent oxidoreductase [Luteibacter rhizovicinus DSM 16549]KLD64600.1 FAD-dependent oxidoreductase [Luteibacter rhizovicinus DSM 16549]KLD74765.1 FAD-dependent oxidoreductase [Xanthomonas hyacinthi DSM 19077]
MLSWYHDRVPAPPLRPPPEGRREASVVIVGGGFAGLNTALGLAARGVRDIVLLESKSVGFGASGRNGGFVFAGYSLGEKALLERAGPERARALYGRTVDAVNLIRERITALSIDCDAVDAGVVWANWFRDAGVLRSRQQLLAEHYGADWQWIPADAMHEFVHSERYHDGLYERNALHIDPLAYARGLARAAGAVGVSIHEGSRVRMLERRGPRWILRVGDAEIETPQVVLACGGYLAGLDRRIDRAVLPIATYVMVTEPLGDRLAACLRTRAAVYDTRFAFDYYRPLQDTRLLWGGRISIRDRSPAAVKRLLKRDLERVFPSLEGVRIEQAWSGLMSYARHEMPQVGTHGNGLWYAQAFGGHGLAPTCAAGEALADAIAGGDSALEAYSGFGLDPVHRPFGYLAAQGTYWKAELTDWFKSRLEG